LPTITIEDGSNHDKEQLVVSDKQMWWRANAQMLCTKLNLKTQRTQSNNMHVEMNKANKLANKKTWVNIAIIQKYDKMKLEKIFVF